MNKRVVGSLVQATAIILALAGAAPAPSISYRQIVRLEAGRTLRGGMLPAALRSKDRSVVVRAALAIGRTKQPAGIPLLLPYTSDSDVAVRGMSVYSIGLIGGAAAGPPLLRALLDRSAMVRIAALDGVDRVESVKAFAARGESTALARVRALLGDERDASVRARAATTLESFASSGLSAAADAALARAYARERNGYVRWHIVWALYRGYAKNAPRAVLSEALRDTNEIVRIEAVRAFGKRGDVSAIALLEPLVDDPSWRVAEQTLESIKLLGGGNLTDHLTRIPAGVRTPAPQPDLFASLRALPRAAPPAGKPAAARIIMMPRLHPSTAAQFTGPARGPHPRVRIVTTKGNMYVELYPEWAPLTVENFLNLMNRGYYDGNPWFRIVPDFVVQTGDDPANGKNGPGYAIPAEENPIEQDSYIISMGLDYTNPPDAHAKRDSAGSEFYITISPQLHLDRDFTVFGRVIAGADVIGRLVESDKIVRVERIPDAE